MLVRRLRIERGCTVAEIARELCVTPDAVRRLLRRMHSEHRPLSPHPPLPPMCRRRLIQPVSLSDVFNV